MKQRLTRSPLVVELLMWVDSANNTVVSKNLSLLQLILVTKTVFFPLLRLLPLHEEGKENAPPASSVEAAAGAGVFGAIFILPSSLLLQTEQRMKQRRSLLPASCSLLFSKHHPLVLLLLSYRDRLSIVFHRHQQDRKRGVCPVTAFFIPWFGFLFFLHLQLVICLFHHLLKYLR